MSGSFLYPPLIIYTIRKPSIYLYKKTRMTILVIRVFHSYFLKIPNGFPTGNTTFPKCVFNTAAAEP